jgi:hypothetical protein
MYLSHVRLFRLSIAEREVHQMNKRTPATAAAAVALLALAVAGAAQATTSNAASSSPSEVLGLRAAPDETQPR